MLNMSYRNRKEFLEKVDGIIAIAKHDGITLSDLEAAHVDRSGETPRILGYLPVYMIWWAHTEKRKDIVERLTAELEAAYAQLPVLKPKSRGSANDDARIL
jgi:hypothetical protein